MKRHLHARNPIEYNPPSADGARWIENVSDGLRVRSVHDIAKSEGWRYPDHTGWYTDDFMDSSETMHGAVVQLPARNGEPRYLIATSDPWNADCYRVDCSRVYSDLRDAVHAADSMAQYAAEEERDFQREESARMRLEDIAGELADNRAAVRAILAERRMAPVESFPALRGAICARIVSLLKQRTALFAERRELEVSL